MPPKASGSKTPARTYTVTLASGDKLDISRIDPGVPVSAEVVDALKRRIIELQDKVEGLEESSEPPAKKARKTPAGSDEKRRKATFKKLWDQLKKDCKSDACQFQGGERVNKVEDAMDLEDFKMIFKPGEIGHLIQPTPDNKPKSTVWQISYNTRAQIESLFGDEAKPLKGNIWTIGGGPSFAKSIKIGPCDVEAIAADLTYQQNTMKVAIKFTVQQVGGSSYHAYSRYNDFW